MPRLINLNRIPSRHRRPAKADLPPWQPGVAALRVLRILRRFHYLSTDLVAMVYAAEHGRGLYEVKRQLTRLWRHGYVERQARRVEQGMGSTQFVYTLNPLGAQLVMDEDEWLEKRHQVYNLAKTRSDTHVEHALATSLLHVLWSLGSPERHDLFTTKAVWRDKDGHNEFKASVDGRPEKIQPDLTVLIAHKGGNYYRPYFFEVERSHKNDERLRRKMKAYGHLLSSRGESAVEDVFERELDITPSRGMLIYIGADENHAQRLRDLADEHVSRQTEIWFTSLDQLILTREKQHKDGTPYVRRKAGFDEPQPVLEEVPIAPREFFGRSFLTALDGKQGVLVV